MRQGMFAELSGEVFMYSDAVFTCFDNISKSSCVCFENRTLPMNNRSLSGVCRGRILFFYRFILSLGLTVCSSYYRFFFFYQVINLVNQLIDLSFDSTNIRLFIILFS